MAKYTFAVLLFIISFSAFSQQNDAFCDKLVALQKQVFENHYKPKILNDSLSKGVYHLFLDLLDEDKEYFLEEDLGTLNKDELEIDDYLLNQNCAFVAKYSDILQKRINQSIAYLETLKNKDLNYNSHYSLRYTPEEFYTYFKDEAELNNALEKKIAYKVISRLLDQYEDLEEITSKFDTLEKELKPKIIDNEICVLTEFLNKTNGFDNYVNNQFLNAYLNYQDPHSIFLSNTDKTIFEDGLSSNQLSFGLITDKNDDGQITVAHVIPGSSAFINGNIEADDVILSLTANNNTLETFCVSNKDVQAYMTNESYDEMTFKIKKSNGGTFDIKLKKSKIKVEDNAIIGYVLSQEETNVGYIQIPSFYTNEESPNGRGVSLDFAKELYKLQKENIEGLVIDLRFNGGGSMQEAIELCGMFIDRGPVSIIKYKNGQSYTLKDTKRGTLFSKPLLILVNSYSASASEFFASTMQDYNRAVIVGSKTHGKSTAQTILPVSIKEDLGFCKITVETFFRVTGKSLQAQGVIPDVKLPSIYDDLKSYESNYQFAIKNQTATVKLPHKPFAAIDVKTLVEKSKGRTENQLVFNSISDKNSKLKQSIFEKGEPYKLSLKAIDNSRKQKINLIDSIFKTNKVPFPLLITNTEATEEVLTFNPEDKSENEDLLEDLTNDIYINESYYIIKDLINNF